MSQSWHDFGLDVFLDFGPCFSFPGRARREELLEIARLDIGDDSSVWESVIIVHNCFGVNARYCTS